MLMVIFFMNVAFIQGMKKKILCFLQDSLEIFSLDLNMLQLITRETINIKQYVFMYNTVNIRMVVVDIYIYILINSSLTMTS